MTNCQLKKSLASADIQVLVAGLILFGTLIPEASQNALVLGIEGALCVGLVTARQIWRRRIWTQWESAQLAPVLRSPQCAL